MSFLNAQPLLHGLLSGLADERMRLTLAPPSELNRQLFEDEADAGLCPVAALANHGGLELVSDCGIGCDGAVRSVKIVGHVPLEEMDELLLDAASRTSVVLARLIARERCGDREPRYSVMSAEEIAQQVGGRVGGLLIGDIALELEGRFPYELDLGAAWKELTGLPFVFAVWVARPDVLDERDVLKLHGSLEAGLKNRAAIARAWARGHGGDSRVYQDYLEHSIRYLLDERALCGLREFFRRATEAGLMPPTVLRFVGQAQASRDGARSARRPSLDALLQEAAQGARLSFRAAHVLGSEVALEELSLAADMRKRALHGDATVTYLVDRSIAYTNVCGARCPMCSFYREQGDAEGFVLTRAQLGAAIEETLASGGSRISLEGGLNPKLHLEWYEDTFRWIKRHYPVALHALSPDEVWHLASIEELSVERVLGRLQSAGLDALHGTGAEVLTDRVRRVIAPAKCKSAQWLQVIRGAHRLGMRSTATMMFGTVDTLEDRLIHLLKIRDVQDESGGFTSFAAWPYRPPETGPRRLPGVQRMALSECLRTQALCRLVLDNIARIEAPWLEQGEELSQLALSCGADDLGSSGLVARAPGAASSRGADEATGLEPALERAARERGFRAVPRDVAAGPSSAGSAGR
ncbi:MAG: CofH family radical SAM protein [Myxococcales bacterium]|nr:CofH family radical SAM protein [Myxococcales bacterium]